MSPTSPSSPTRRNRRQLRAIFASMAARAQGSALGRRVTREWHDPEVRSVGRDIGVLVASYYALKHLPTLHRKVRGRLRREPTAMDILREATFPPGKRPTLRGRWRIARGWVKRGWRDLKLFRPQNFRNLAKVARTI